MSTQNGVSDTTSTTKLKSFLRSMRLRVFLIVVLTGCVMGYLFCSISINTTKRETVESKINAVSDYTDKLVIKMASNAYTVYPQQATEINRELATAALLYSARIIVTDAHLVIVYDSYGLELGKTLISSETIGALRGVRSRYRNDSRNTVELSIPIAENSGLTSGTPGNQSLETSLIQGAMIISFSIEDCLQVADTVSTIMIIVLAVVVFFLIIFSAESARVLTKPFNKISQSLHHVSEGYIDDKVDIGGFSEMDRVSDAFNEMLQRISTMEESRQEFVSNVSHELKTPITSVKVLADSLLQQPDAPVELYREFMTDINAEIDRESQIINDLLALVKLDRKSGDMHVAEVSINELIDIILHRVKPIAQAAGIELIYESYRDVLAEVDETKLSLALTNLIENGIKYNRENGSVKVSLNADHRFFMITVSDTGIGIPEAECDRIFERFYRVDKMRSRQTGGTGLGLAITKSVVLMHHGAIKVESTEGVGTTFLVRIPLSYIPEA